MINPVACSKCGGRMIKGSLFNKDTNGGKSLSQWVEGKPERSLWTGLKTKGLEMLPVTSFRCARCGFLETYAEG